MATILRSDQEKDRNVGKQPCPVLHFSAPFLRISGIFCRSSEYERCAQDIAGRVRDLS